MLVSELKLGDRLQDHHDDTVFTLGEVTGFRDDAPVVTWQHNFGEGSFDQVLNECNGVSLPAHWEVLR